MLGVDKLDQLIAAYNVLMKCVRWWKTLFFHCIDIAVVNSLIIFQEHRQQHRWAYVKLRFMSANCEATVGIYSGERMNPFTVNILATRVMQPTGNQQTAFNDISSLMGIGRQTLNTKTRQSYVKTKLTPAAERAVSLRTLRRTEHVSHREHRSVV